MHQLSFQISIKSLVSLSLCSLVHAASLERFFGDCMNRIEPGTKKGLRDRNSPTCTLSQNGYGVSKQSASNNPVVPAAEPHHKPLRLLATFAYRRAPSPPNLSTKRHVHAAPSNKKTCWRSDTGEPPMELNAFAVSLHKIYAAGVNPHCANPVHLAGHYTHAVLSQSGFW